MQAIMLVIFALRIPFENHLQFVDITWFYFLVKVRSFMRVDLKQ